MNKLKLNTCFSYFSSDRIVMDISYDIDNPLVDNDMKNQIKSLIIKEQQKLMKSLEVGITNLVSQVIHDKI